MQTPAGREREHYTSLILDHPDQELVKAGLEELVGSARVRAIRRAMVSNGGGLPTVRDYCAELSVDNLNLFCRVFNLK